MGALDEVLALKVLRSPRVLQINYDFLVGKIDAATLATQLTELRDSQLVSKTEKQWSVREDMERELKSNPYAEVVVEPKT